MTSNLDHSVSKLLAVTIIKKHEAKTSSSLSRWINSCDKYGIKYEIIRNKHENGNDDQIEGSLWPLNVLHNVLLANKKEYILFTDHNSSFMLGSPIDILNYYKKATNNDSDKILYPVRNGKDKDNVSGFIGRARTLLKLLDKKNNISAVTQLDTKCLLFQNVANCSKKTDLGLNGSILHNKATNTYPKILCTDDANRLRFNSLENYTLNNFVLNNSKLDKSNLPRIDIFAFGTKGNSLNVVKSLDTILYPPDLLRVWVFCEYGLIIPNTKYNSKTIFIQTDMRKAHDSMIKMMLSSNADYAWLIYEDYVITEPNILADCIKTNKLIVAPLFRKAGKDERFSNFWGDLDSNGFYSRSEDYVHILNQTTKTVWNVPYVAGNILIKKDIIVNNPNLFVKYDNLDTDMQLCRNLRECNELMYVLNANMYGVIEDEPNNEYVTLSNKTKWSPKDYLHPDFYDFIYGADPDSKPDPRKSDKSIFKQILPDVWQFPIFSERFCHALIAEAESFGKWSAGNNATYDPRLPGKHEYYPTQDIHLNQIGLHDFWLDKVVHGFFAKVMSHLYKYKSKGYNIAFIARYKFGEQVKLSPHHDSSVYTTNIALNECGVEYEGGGCRYVYMDKKLTHTPIGYVNLHPGKLSHYHEGLPITSGKRYILVSFNE